MQKEVLHNYCPSGFIISWDFGNDEKEKTVKIEKIWTSAVSRHFGGMLVKSAFAGMAQEIDVFFLEAWLSKRDPGCFKKLPWLPGRVLAV